jgi:hypothetical protein
MSSILLAGAMIIRFATYITLCAYIQIDWMLSVSCFVLAIAFKFLWVMANLVTICFTNWISDLYAIIDGFGQSIPVQGPNVCCLLDGDFSWLITIDY